MVSASIAHGLHSLSMKLDNDFRYYVLFLKGQLATVSGAPTDRDVPNMQTVAVSRNTRPSESAAVGSAQVGTGAIILHRFGPFLGAPDSSPFVIKVMVL